MFCQVAAVDSDHDSDLVAVFPFKFDDDITIAHLKEFATNAIPMQLKMRAQGVIIHGVVSCAPIVSTQNVLFTKRTLSGMRTINSTLIEQDCTFLLDEFKLSDLQAIWNDLPPYSVFLIVLCSINASGPLASIEEEERSRPLSPFVRIADSIRRRTGSPSDEAKNDALCRTQQLSRIEAIYNGRPDTLTGPSISIFHPIFQTFRARLSKPFKNTDYSRQDFRAADTLLRKAAAYYADENDRRAALEHPIAHFLGRGAVTSTHRRSGRQTFIPDGSLDVKCGLFGEEDPGLWKMCKELTEIKNGAGLGGCDPMEQNEKDFVLVCIAPELKALRRVSCMPAFLIAIPGHSISISGAIYLDGVVSGNLLHYFPLVPPNASSCEIQAGYPSYRDQHVGLLVHTLRVLRGCLDELDLYYGQMEPLDVDKFPLLPAPHFQTFTPPISGPVQLRYLERCNTHFTRNPQAVFLAEATGGFLQQPTNCIVKFTAQYCKEAHELMFDEGVAAPLFHCKWEESVGMYVVITKYLEESEGASLSPEGLDKLRKALKMLHQKGFVYGDLRTPNIILDTNGHPRLIDFDWSGVAGEVQYPGNLNMDAGFPTGVKGCDFITAEHDWVMLKKYEESFTKKG
ncbi:unnamed protein product [Cyclocybe aegerita]|uniref:Protein kinase domain-containing protein n=1 Tax=Cyclocybe aegerita TaxID=1973307 RepID=A0A8S0WWM9_CYCAE|nr:unnamed protein product [Cyclocybe aegerita]